jgi:uncharacterized membrane protein YjfL (UPF0719 family)
MSSEQVLDTIGRVLATIGWSLVGVLVFYAGTRLFDMLDPVDYAAEIKRGNVAAALKLAAVTLGLAAIIIAAIVT